MSDNNEIQGIGHRIIEDSTLHEGDVAIIIRADGSMDVAHNVTEIKNTGSVTGGKDAAGLLLAMTMIEIADVEEDLLAATLVKLVRRLEGGELKLVSFNP